MVYRFISCCILSFALATTAVADRIVIAADEWCPLNCVPESEKPGVMVEIAQAVFSPQGHTVEYKVMNWPRAIREARVGNINAIIGAFKGDAPDFIFPHQELSVLSNTFFVRKDHSWRFSGVKSLQQIQLAAIAGYDYGDELREYIQESGSSKVSLLSSHDHPLAKGIKLLHRKRVDAVIEADPVFWYTAQELGLKDEFISAGRSEVPEKAYIAFSPALASSADYAQMLSNGVEQLRKSGELEKILQRYGLSDWR